MSPESHRYPTWAGADVDVNAAMQSHPEMSVCRKDAKLKLITNYLGLRKVYIYPVGYYPIYVISPF